MVIKQRLPEYSFIKRILGVDFLNKERKIKKEFTHSAKKNSSSVGILIVTSVILGVAAFVGAAFLVSLLLSKSSDYMALMPFAVFLPICAGCLASSFFAVKKSGNYFSSCVALSVIFVIMLAIVGSISEPCGDESLTLEVTKLASVPIFCLVFGRFASDNRNKSGRKRRKI